MPWYQKIEIIQTSFESNTDSTGFHDDDDDDDDDDD